MLYTAILQIVSIAKMYHTRLEGTFSTYLQPKFHIPSSNASLDITITVKVTYRFCMADILFTQYKQNTLTKIAYFKINYYTKFQDPTLSGAIKVSLPAQKYAQLTYWYY
jgi:hypothetical protein